MKALLICPVERDSVAALTEWAPLCNVPVAGKSVVEYWLDHLAQLGAREVGVLASDRPEQVRALVGNGARWGISVAVYPEKRELTAGEARAKYRGSSREGWLQSPFDAVLMDHMPGMPEFPLFESYAGWVTAVQAWLPRAVTPDRIGTHELLPGVWVGMHTKISPRAELRAPCWIGDHVYLGDGAVVGPMAVVEQAAYIEGPGEVSHSIVGPQTFVGQFTEIANSVAWGNTLVNWKRDSCIKVPDAFLLCALNTPAPFDLARFLGRLAAILTIVLTLPLALYASIKSILLGRPVFRPMRAVRPRPPDAPGLPGDTLIYYEFASVGEPLRRWPQLWSILIGDFVWIGNRPLRPRQVRALSRDFERLWLAAPLGLISLADVEVCTDFRNDDTRAHAMYYAARANWRLDFTILMHALILLAFGVSYSRAHEYFVRLFHFHHAEERKTPQSWR